jgi:uncharacterized protein DUF5655
MSWACRRCDRTFRQVNQRHACGVGSAATLLKGRPAALTDLYRKLETTLRGFGDVEVVTRNRCALFRTTRIFADLTVIRDALRVVIHLGRKAEAPCFIKIGQGDNRVTHVTVIRTAGTFARSFRFCGKRSTSPRVKSRKSNPLLKRTPQQSVPSRHFGALTIVTRP